MCKCVPCAKDQNKYRLYPCYRKHRKCRLLTEHVRARSARTCADCACTCATTVQLAQLTTAQRLAALPLCFPRGSSLYDDAAGCATHLVHGCTMNSDSSMPHRKRIEPADLRKRPLDSATAGEPHSRLVERLPVRRTLVPGVQSRHTPKVCGCRCCCLTRRTALQSCFWGHHHREQPPA